MQRTIRTIPATSSDAHMVTSLDSNGLRFDMFTGEERFIAPNAVLVFARTDAVLIDCGFVKTDVDKLLHLVKASGKRLRAIFITHAHPHHYGGINVFAEAFPDAVILARQGVIDGMCEWPAKRVHWQDMFGSLLPGGDIVYPRPLLGKAAYLEDREIIFIDSPIAETVHSTAFYLPSARALVAGDLIFSRYHLNMTDTNNPDSWIKAIEQARGIGPIVRILGFSGSLRQGSYNRALLRAASELAPEDVLIEIFDLLQIPLYNADVEARGDPEPVSAFKQAIRQADAVLMVTPEYNHGVPGVMKNAVDWASRPPRSSVLNAKPVAIIGTAPGITGTARGQSQLRQAFEFTNSYAMPQPVLLVFRANEKFDTAGKLTDETTREHLRKFLEAFRAWTLQFKSSQS